MNLQSNVQLCNVRLELKNCNYLNRSLYFLNKKRE